MSFWYPQTGKTLWEKVLIKLREHLGKAITPTFMQNFVTLAMSTKWKVLLEIINITHFNSVNFKDTISQI